MWPRAWYTDPPVREPGAGYGGGDTVRWITIGLMVGGALILIVTLLADVLGIGAAGSDFGWKQLIGTTLGAGLLFGGARGWWETTRTRAGGTEREG